MSLPVPRQPDVLAELRRSRPGEDLDRIKIYQPLGERPSEAEMIRALMATGKLSSTQAVDIARSVSDISDATLLNRSPRPQGDRMTFSR